MEEIRLSVTREGVEAFVICVAIGTLRSIERGALTEDAGIWCLGRPVFWEPLAKRGLISPEVAELLGACDELGAIRELAGEAAKNEAIAAALATLDTRLRAIADPLWRAAWE
jgi:hypothetical protein